MAIFTKNYKNRIAAESFAPGPLSVTCMSLRQFAQQAAQLRRFLNKNTINFLFKYLPP